MIPLTARQIQILQLVADGLTDQQIARALGISRNTVMLHMTDIRYRLEVHSRTAAATKAFRERLIA